MLITRVLPFTRCLACNGTLAKQFPLKYNLTQGYVNRQIGLALRSFSTGSPPGTDNTELVYHGSLSGRMKAVKVFSLTTSLTGMAAQPIIYEQAGKIGGTPIIVLMCGFVGFFTFVTPVLLHFITKKYVTDIVYNRSTEEYTATTISIFLTKVETKFKASDVRVPDVPGMFTSFIVGTKPLLVEPTMFTDPEHYVKIMGYDKPIDFRLDRSETQESSEKGENKKNK